MIYLQQNIENYNNDIRAMLQAFYPGEKIVIKKEGESLFDFVGEFNQKVSFKILVNNQVVDEISILCEYENKKTGRNPIKKALYLLLSRYAKKQLPWGSLTGIRPTKIATELIEKGYTEEDILKEYKDVYVTTNQKAEMCVDIAKRENKIIKGMDLDSEFSIYIGIPFCPSTCLYCSFTSYAINQYRNKVDDYLNSLFKEIEYVSEKYKNKKLISIYFGGGTPTSIEAEQLDRLLKKVKSEFDLSHLKEITVEAGRPDSITVEKLQALMINQVSRISINPQTMNNKTLKLIGRAHSSQKTIESFELARKCGFENINMDIIVGLPGENLQDITYTLDEINKLQPESLTVHSLAIKRAAALNIEMEKYQGMIKGSTNEMLNLVDLYAKNMNLKPYYLYRQKNIPGNLENIGYAVEGKECYYNILIMEEKHDIIAMGAGASSKLVFSKENRIERIENVKNVDEYIGRIDEMIARKSKYF